MIDMALLSVLRRWYFRDGMPTRDITRRTRLFRNTVRRYLASGELEPRYRRPKSPRNLMITSKPSLTGFIVKSNVRANSALRLSILIKIQCKCWVIIGCNLTDSP